jgi:hypothetical protein
VKNPAGTASSKKSGSNIKFSSQVINSLTKKRDEYNEKHSGKVDLSTLKAVYRRGAGAYSSSHRPTITGGVPNSRNAWAMARVNKFLLKKSGKPVKKAYVQDDDLMAEGGQTAELIAPNGKPSNLTPEQYRLVRTPEFKAWFGDWEKDPENASKVVDENGEPMVMYHGGTQDFTIFDIKKSGQSNKDAKAGFWFTPLKQFASNFLEGTWWGDKGNRKVYEVFLSIKNPKEYFTLEVDKDEKEKLYDDMRSIAKQKDKLSNAFRFEFSEQMAFRAGITAAEYPKRIEEYKDAKPNIKEAFEDGVEYAELQKQYKESKNRYDELIYSDSYEIFRTDIYKIAGKTAQDANVGGLGMALDNAEGVLNMYREKLKSDGYDGITIFQTRFDAIDAGGLNDQYVALYPEQIKLADGSNSTFDPENPDIRFAEGGQVKLLAPNGKPSNLTPEQYRLIRTPEFKAWFGDWENDPQNASKVVDENGEPMVVYHGTDEVRYFGYPKENVKLYFEPKKSNYAPRTLGGGVYFSSNVKAAVRYSDYGFVVECFLRLKNPRILNGLEKHIREIIPEDNPMEYGNNDGIIIKDVYDTIGNVVGDKYFLGNTYIVKKSASIKLADGSNTTFNPKNPDIRYAKGGFTNQIIRCKGCGWQWDTKDSDESDKYVCHQCGFDNRTFYDADPIGRYAEGGETSEVNADNYFVSTKAYFEGVDPKDAKEILEAYKDYRRRKNKPEFIKSTKYGNLRVDYESEKKNAYFERRSLSYYFVTDDNSSVIRISDHWSNSQYDDSEKLNCGNIRSCFWTTDGNRFRYDIPNQKHTSILIAGICPFNEFEMIPKITFDKGGETTHDEHKSVENYATETINNQNMPDNNYAKGGEMDDCGCGKAEDGMEVSTKKELPVGKLAKGMTLEQIARLHRYSPILLRKNLKEGIKTEMEHTDDKEIAEAIALDHLYEDPEYYRKLKLVETLDYGTKSWQEASMAMGGKPDHESIEISHYIFDQREKAYQVIYSDDPKISRFMICLKLYDAAKMHENSTENPLEKNMWLEISHIWKMAMNDVKNDVKPTQNIQEIMSLSNIFVYANGGLAYGNSHKNGGIKLLNKSTNTYIEIEGGEGVVKADSMQLKEKMEFEGEKLTACEIVSKINERTGGVKFKCSDVKRIIDNDGKFA